MIPLLPGAALAGVAGPPGRGGSNCASVVAEPPGSGGSNGGAAFAARVEDAEVGWGAQGSAPVFVAAFAGSAAPAAGLASSLSEGFLAFAPFWGTRTMCMGKGF